MRDLGLSDEAARIMAEHGRDPARQFDEPMMGLRNQGQILGAERKGDIILAYGRREGNTLVAARVEVIEPGTMTPGLRDDVVVGELMRRTENVLQVDAGGELFTVEVAPNAVAVSYTHLTLPTSDLV